MFVRFREMKAQRYGLGERECAGKCKDRPRHYPRYGLGMVVKGRTFLEGCPMKPLCPLKEPRTRLVVQIVETVREGGKMRQKHVVSLGSLKDGDTLTGRESFWLECEPRLARLANRLGPELDRLRQQIAARIPPLNDTEREALIAWAWENLESGWQGHSDGKTREASKLNELAMQCLREATTSETIALKVKQLQGDEEAYPTLNNLLGVTLAGGAKGWTSKRVETERRLLAELDELLKAKGLK